MAARGGRLEATITVPVGGWAVSANAGGGAFTATIPAGDYLFSELLAQFEIELDAGPGGEWTLAVSNGESVSATDRVTIANANTCSITWTATDLRDVLGFTGNLSGATSYVGTLHPIGYWRPNVAKWSPYGDEGWDTFSDLRQTISPSGGQVKTLCGNTFEALEGVRWELVAYAKAVGTQTPGTWQYFWNITTTGTFSFILPGCQLGLFWNADSGSHDDCYMIVPANSSIPPVINGWTGLYRVEIPMLVRSV